MVEQGFHVLSVQWPAFDSLSVFLKGLDDFLAHLYERALSVSKTAGKQAASRDIHIVGEGLGGLLGMQYAAMRPQHVKSVVLINSFVE